MSASLTAVLVLYRMQPEASACFRSLRQAVSALDLPAADLSLLIYDNSPEPSALPHFPARIRYLHDAANGGIAAAYNAGLADARSNGSPWLLLLDQDTELTAEYLRELFDAIGSVPAETVAIVPRLVQDGHTHSPHPTPRLSHQSLPAGAQGLLRQRVSAYNSGAAIRVSALPRFPQRYWLDFLDHAVFSELQANGGRIWLMRSGLEHRLSTQKLGEEASLERYLNVLSAERDFFYEYGSLRDRIFYHLRRFKEATGQLLKISDKRFSLMSYRAALGLLGPTARRK